MGGGQKVLGTVRPGPATELVQFKANECQLGDSMKVLVGFTPHYSYSTCVLVKLPQQTRKEPRCPIVAGCGKHPSCPVRISEEGKL